MNDFLRRAWNAMRRRMWCAYGTLFPAYYSKRSMRSNMKRSHRCLEIGPGKERIHGFETLNIVSGEHVDYIADAAKRLPFPEDTFEIIYASHILEHVPWYMAQDVLTEWVRVLAPNGHLEICVPDGVKICKAFVDAEVNGISPFENDPWYRLNEEKDPCKWASGRLFTWGDGTGDPSHPNWHRAVFSERYLRLLLGNAGLSNISRLDRAEIRGYDHGWINLGMKGTKKHA